MADDQSYINARAVEISKTRLQKIDGYRVGRTIGKGNFAAVRIAFHEVANCKVAMKIVDMRILDEENLKKVEREISALKKLNDHPHIVRLYQIVRTTHFICIITEYLPNGELFDLLMNQGKLSENEARRIFQQIVAAVAYCHKFGIVHRDLKAENLLLDKKGNIKLIDFGFCNDQSPDHLLSTWCGSPPYAAPELLLAQEYDGRKSDVWSLGVILYILVTAGFPFPGDSVDKLKRAMLSEQLKIPFWVSPDCADLIRKMLTISPSLRIGLCNIAQHKWVVAKMTVDIRELFTCCSISIPAQQSQHHNTEQKASPYSPSLDPAIIIFMQQHTGVSEERIIEEIIARNFESPLFGTYQLLSSKLANIKSSCGKITSTTFSASSPVKTIKNNQYDQMVQASKCIIDTEARRGSRGSIISGRTNVDNEPTIGTIPAYYLARLSISSSPDNGPDDKSGDYSDDDAPAQYEELNEISFLSPQMEQPVSSSRLYQQQQSASRQNRLSNNHESDRAFSILHPSVNSCRNILEGRYPANINFPFSPLNPLTLAPGQQFTIADTPENLAIKTALLSAMQQHQNLGTNARNLLHHQHHLLGTNSSNQIFDSLSNLFTSYHQSISQFVDCRKASNNCLQFGLAQRFGTNVCMPTDQNQRTQDHGFNQERRASANEALFGPTNIDYYARHLIASYSTLLGGSSATSLLTDPHISPLPFSWNRGNNIGPPANLVGSSSNTFEKQQHQHLFPGEHKRHHSGTPSTKRLSTSPTIEEEGEQYLYSQRGLNKRNTLHAGALVGCSSAASTALPPSSSHRNYQRPGPYSYSGGNNERRSSWAAAPTTTSTNCTPSFTTVLPQRAGGCSSGECSSTSPPITSQQRAQLEELYLSAIRSVGASGTNVTYSPHHHQNSGSDTSSGHSPTAAAAHKKHSISPPLLPVSATGVQKLQAELQKLYADSVYRGYSSSSSSAAPAAPPPHSVITNPSPSSCSFSPENMDATMTAISLQQNNCCIPSELDAPEMPSSFVLPSLPSSLMLPSDDNNNSNEQLQNFILNNHQSVALFSSPLMQQLSQQLAPLINVTDENNKNVSTNSTTTIQNPNCNQQISGIATNMEDIPITSISANHNEKRLE